MFILASFGTNLSSKFLKACLLSLCSALNSLSVTLSINSEFDSSMARVLSRLFYRFPATQVLDDQSTGTLNIRFRSHYRKRTPFGVEVLPQSNNASRTALDLVLPNEFPLRPDIIRDCLSDNFERLRLDIDPEYLVDVAHDVVASYWSALDSCRPDPPGTKGYYMAVEMECCYIVEVDEVCDVLDTQFAKLDSVMVSDATDSEAMGDVVESGFAYLDSVLDDVLDPYGMDSEPEGYFLESVVANLNSVLFPDATDSAATEGGGTGASRKMIENLIKTGGFVTGEADQNLGTCSVCLEELSSSAGTELLRTNCPHIFHQSCLVPWLEKRTTCPYCRRQLD